MTLILQDSRFAPPMNWKGPRPYLELTVHPGIGIRLNEFVILLLDLCAMVEYVMTNTDLEEDDPRVDLKREIIDQTLPPDAEYAPVPEHLNRSEQVPDSIRRPRRGDIVEVKSHSASCSPNYLGQGGAEIRIGDCYLSMEDFCLLVRKSALCPTDVASDDPRSELRELMRRLEVLPGHNKGGLRYGLPEAVTP